MKVIAKRSCSLLEFPFCVFNCQPVILLVALKLSRSEVQGASISFREEGLDSGAGVGGGGGCVTPFS